jgi:hypothetical protein
LVKDNQISEYRVNAKISFEVLNWPVWNTIQFLSLVFQAFRLIHTFHSVLHHLFHCRVSGLERICFISVFDWPDANRETVIRAIASTNFCTFFMIITFYWLQFATLGALYSSFTICFSTFFAVEILIKFQLYKDRAFSTLNFYTFPRYNYIIHTLHRFNRRHGECVNYINLYCNYVTVTMTNRCTFILYSALMSQLRPKIGILKTKSIKNGNDNLEFRFTSTGHCGVIFCFCSQFRPSGFDQEYEA